VPTKIVSRRAARRAIACYRRGTAHAMSPARLRFEQTFTPPMHKKIAHAQCEASIPTKRNADATAAQSSP